MKRWLLILGIVLIVLAGGTFVFAQIKNHQPAKQIADEPVSSGISQSAQIPLQPVVTHIATPDPVKALYMSAWTASSSKSRQHVVDLLATTEANAVVLDIKDDTGRVSFLVDDPEISDTGSPQNRIRDIRAFINQLHVQNIYVIGRISVFQDPYMAQKNSAWAITKKSNGSVWVDRKGLAFLDPANKNVWDYIAALAHDSYAVGFDEINFDYVRYPSDGDIKNIDYKLTTDANGVKTTRADNIAAFFKYLYETTHATDPGIKTSADLFGLTTTATDDMGIGQILENALPYFDYIAPMVYPSHYGHDFNGLLHPELHPYEVVNGSLLGGIVKLDALKKKLETSIQNGTAADQAAAQAELSRLSMHQFRPWLQDFTLFHVVYTADMIKLEKKALYDAGIDSWMMWDPSNRYTLGAYLSKGAVDQIAIPAGSSTTSSSSTSTPALTKQ